MKRVIHLIPYDATGGVEVAARSMREVRCPEFDFSVQSVYKDVPGYQERQVTFDLRPLLAALKRTRSQRPDLLIVSLWRACIIGALVKLTRPSMRLVLMLHSTKHAHWLDRAVTRFTGSIADEWWGDSSATLNERLPGSPGKTKRVISFVTRRLRPAAPDTPAPHFLFWGRVSAIKGLDRALRLFAQVLRVHPDATFRIIGPDGGALHELRALTATLGLGSSVSFLGEMDIADIARQAASASFYLQASRHEGMAMSVVEAMQLGLVPVVTPVGEIRNYCRSGENAILIQSDEQALRDLLALLADRSRYRELQQSVARAWSDQVLYADSMLDACRSALSQGGKVPS